MAVLFLTALQAVEPGQSQPWPNAAVWIIAGICLLFAWIAWLSYQDHDGGSDDDGFI